MANERASWADELCERWRKEAAALERMADNATEYPLQQRAVLRAQACQAHRFANELSLESRRVRRHG